MEVYLHVGQIKQPVTVKPKPDGIEITTKTGKTFSLEGGLAGVLRSWASRLDPGAETRGEALAATIVCPVTSQDLTGDPANDWALIAARFPWLAEYIPTRETQPNGSSSRAEKDFAIIKFMVEELFDSEGQLVWGAQSRIAEALGFTNAGVSNRKRINAVVEYAQTKFFGGSKRV